MTETPEDLRAKLASDAVEIATLKKRILELESEAVGREALFHRFAQKYAEQAALLDPKTPSEEGL